MNGTQKVNKSPLEHTDTFSGKLYWLNPPAAKAINLTKIAERLEDKSIQRDISKEYEDRDIIVPGVFKEDGNLVRTTTIDNVGTVTNNGTEVVTGDIILDNVREIQYRSNKILTLDTATAKFLIFKESGVCYIAILGSRDLATTVESILRAEFPEVGSLINSTEISGDGISTIGNSLDAVLIDTITTDFDQSEITSTRIQGEDYEDTTVYDAIGSGGKVKSHMFQTESLTSDSAKTILIGRDGLIRIYSNSTLQTYLRLLIEYVIPEIKRIAGSSPTIEAWESVADPKDKSIFEER